MKVKENLGSIYNATEKTAKNIKQEVEKVRSLY